LLLASKHWKFLRHRLQALKQSHPRRDACCGDHGNSEVDSRSIATIGNDHTKITPTESDRIYSICISGWYGSGNTGDEAILTQFINELRPGHNLKLCILAGNVGRTYSMYATRDISVLEHPFIIDRWSIVNLLRKRVWALIRVLQTADLFVLGGGSLLADRSRLLNLIYLLDEIWLAKLLGCKVALYAIGVGPLRRRIARRIVAATVRKCDLIAVRDGGSKELLVSLGVPQRQIEVVADPALLLEPRAISLERLPIVPADVVDFEQKPIGVFLIDDLGIGASRKEAVIRSLAAAFDALYRLLGVQFVFVPMMSERHDDDRLIGREVVKQMRCPEAGFVLEKTLMPGEMMWLVGQFRANITMRLHAFLFSLAMRTPAIAVSRDPKMSNAARDFGLSAYLMDFDTLSAEGVERAVIDLEGSRHKYMDILNETLPERYKAAGRMFKLIRGLMVA
jgi:polysaccharide pyruvyl transferase CsaB